jgi:xanthine dehydrogenase YagS FAD-binding subunit
MDWREGRIASLDVVLGGVATVPWSIGERLRSAHGLPYDDERMTAAVRAAIEAADPLSLNAYKVPLARSLAERALRQLATEAPA